MLGRSRETCFSQGLLVFNEDGLIFQRVFDLSMKAVGFFQGYVWSVPRKRFIHKGSLFFHEDD